ncbi:CvpA family protein [Flavobacteriaceae bacterium]|nr:CvpA family protein [Flavobacteriaceae bacterium]
MNYIDIAIVGLVIFGAVKGFSKGFIIEAASLIALILGLIGALLFSSTVGTLLQSFIDADRIPPSGVLFILTFIAIIIGINLLAKFLTRVLKMAALGGLNRLLGAVFGGLKFILILSAITLILDQFEFLFTFMEDDIIDESQFYEPVKSIGSIVLEWLLDKKDLLPEELV